MSNKFVSNETCPVDLDLKGVLYTKFQGLKVWGHALLIRIVCFLLFNNRKSFENAAKSAFLIKRMPKIELFQVLSFE